MRTPARNRARGCAWLLAGASLASCASPRPADPVAANLDTEPPPVLSMRREGLEVHWWVGDDAEGRVARALASLAAAEVQPGAWRASGLRLIAAADAEFERVRQAVPPLSQQYRQFVGWTAEWREVFRGRRIAGEPLTVNAAPRTIARGATRLLARCWPMPPIERDGSPRVRLDLAFQVVPDGGREPTDPFATPRATPEHERGMVLHDLTVEFVVEPGMIYVITSDLPEADWRSPAPRGTVETGFSPPPEEALAMSPTATVPFGPISAPPVSFGEAMLSIPSADGASAARQALIVLYARPPERFRLLR